MRTGSGNHNPRLVILFPPSAEKSSSLPGSSRELAEIFGTSDDEEDMDFPFSMNVDKSFPDLSLNDGRMSEFFLKSINSLSVPVRSTDSTLVPSSDSEKLVPDLPMSATESGVKVKDKAAPEVEGVEGVKITTADNVIPESERVTGVERVNTASAAVDIIPKEVKVVTGMEGVKESTEMDTSCTEDNKSSEDNIGEEEINIVTSDEYFNFMVGTSPLQIRTRGLDRVAT